MADARSEPVRMNFYPVRPEVAANIVRDMLTIWHRGNEWIETLTDAECMAAAPRIFANWIGRRQRVVKVDLLVPAGESSGSQNQRVVFTFENGSMLFTASKAERDKGDEHETTDTDLRG